MCGLVLATALGPAGPPPAAEAQKALHGTWVATKAERDGKPADDVVGHRLSFTGNRFQIRSKSGASLYDGTVRLEPGARPAAIDVAQAAGALKGKAWKGIYAVEGDTLTICDNAPDLTRPRPANFEARAGSGHVSITFARAPRADRRVGPSPLPCPA